MSKCVKTTVAVALLATVSGSAGAADIGDVRLKGYVAERFEACLENHVLKSDATYFSRVFNYQEDVGNWQTEFWGKYMHSAAPLWRYTGDAGLKDRMDRSARDIVVHQLPDGYLGNYREGKRAGGGWDVWGNKYTMLGLLFHYTATGEKSSLEAAKKLGDYLIATFGPGKKTLHKTGCWRGLPSCSVLEPVTWLYRLTKERRYLDFATYVVSELDGEGTARLIRDALAGVDVGERVSWKQGENFWVASSRKAYEMMSCYQGLLDYAEASGRADCREAAVAAAKSIAKTEINIVGGGSAHENWYGGAKRQTRTYEYEQETCVVTTWIRLCQRLLEVTGDTVWADELEKSFYNAYLASLRSDGGAFLQYNPLAGTRHLGEDHCHLHTNCCNANGPRGFIAFLESLLLASGNEARLNFYSSGTYSVRLPATGERVVLEGYTHYPKTSDVHLRVRSEKPAEFTLALRIPSWSKRTSVVVNKEAVKDVTPGTYCRITRTWRPGDHVDVTFDMKPTPHFLDGFVAFTAGPVALARDARFADGPMDLVVNGRMQWQSLDMKPVRTTDPRMWITHAAFLNLGTHHKNWNEQLPDVVRFCDYASAGNTWSPESAYRVWLPVELPLPEHLAPADDAAKGTAP